ncbi:MAG: glycosyl hydrolase family 28-related protein [bacterium]|nr:glycosyl hydrolase family 28-related protein [bacterium]
MQAAPATVAVLSLVLGVCMSHAVVAGIPGAAVPWTTYEAEDMAGTGTRLGPGYSPHTVEAESSGRQCVKLASPGQYVELTAQQPANALVVRYSMPDAANGGGIDATVSLYTNGIFARKLAVTSTYAWQYGAYSWTNYPAAGSPRNFYDEARVKDLTINASDIVRIQKDATDTAAYYIIDLVDLENIAPALAQPPGTTSNWLNVKAAPFSAAGNGTNDDTTALKNCVSVAMAQGKNVWVPAGTYKLTDYIDGLKNVTVQGAGMWHTTFVADPVLANTTPTRRPRFNGGGDNVHLADFAVIGYRTYRIDTQPGDGIGGSFGTNSTIARLWLEHTSVGVWVVNSLGLLIEDCRARNTIADGYNLCVGVRGSVISNCTARGTGDDCFATWPATYIAQTYKPGLNRFTHCTGQLAYLAQGGSLYGGEGNAIDQCLFQDMTYGSGVLISGTFEVGPNVFSGTTLVQNSAVMRCGGYFDKAALKFMLENHPITNVILNNLSIVDSVSHAIGVDREQVGQRALREQLGLGHARLLCRLCLWRQCRPLDLQ